MGSEITGAVCSLSLDFAFALAFVLVRWIPKSLAMSVGRHTVRLISLRQNQPPPPSAARFRLAALSDLLVRFDFGMLSFVHFFPERNGRMA
jgi:hypothetical protein